MEAIYRVKQSRKQWKNKATQRAMIIQILRKSVKREREKVRDLQQRIQELEEKLTAAGKAESPAKPSTDPAPAASKPSTRVLCVTVVLRSVVSFRSVPRILQTFLDLGRLEPGSWIPHFTSVISWVLRYGLSRLRAVTASSKRWIAIVDCSIDIGVQKALVVLRVNLDALALRGGHALSLSDVECVGIKIGPVWNGETVQAALDGIFAQAGKPTAILKDGGTDLNRGVALWREKNGAKATTWVIDDIGHVVANALKAEFSGSKAFEQFLTVVSRGSARIRQTVLAGLMPPKIRTKGRFQGIGRLAVWAGKILELLSGTGRAAEYSVTTRLRRAFAGLSALRPFIERFRLECDVAHEVMKLLKNQGLNQASYKTAQTLLLRLPPRSVLRERCRTWLQKHLHLQCRLGMRQQPLIVSSDILESLFGKFKLTLQRSPLAEMTGMALAIPALCGTVAAADIQQGLQDVTHRDLHAWKQIHIPPTMQQFRRTAFDLRRGEWVPAIGTFG